MTYTLAVIVKIIPKQMNELSSTESIAVSHVLEFIMSLESLSKFSDLAASKHVLTVKYFILGQECILRTRNRGKEIRNERENKGKKEKKSGRQVVSGDEV